MLDLAGQNLLFIAARTHNAWDNRPVTDADLTRIYDLCRWGPTSANCSPMRIVFVRSADAKAKLELALSPGNRAKTMAAPVTAILAYDLAFAQHMPKLFPHQPDAANWFTEPTVKATTAFRNGTLQAGYFMLAARAIGLDCGPMSGFDNAKVDAAFFAGTEIKSNFLCNLGHGDPAGLFARGPRLDFGEVCQIV